MLYVYKTFNKRFMPGGKVYADIRGGSLFPGEVASNNSGVIENVDF